MGEEESALKKAEVADGIVEKDCHESKTPTAEEANVIIIIIMDIYIYLERERERERECRITVQACPGSIETFNPNRHPWGLCII